MNHDAGQVALIRAMATGRGHVVGIARAGTGKTTTLRVGLTHMSSGTKRVVAFNRSIRDDWDAWRRANSAYDVYVDTFHGLALRAVKLHVGAAVEIDAQRGRNIARRVALGWQKQQRANGVRPEDFNVVSGGGRVLFDAVEAWREMPWHLHKFVELCKNVHPASLTEAEALATHYDYVNGAVGARTWAQLAQSCMKTARETFRDKLDFADLMYLPRYNNWRPAPVPYVLVDELQDMNRAQRWLALASMDPDYGRFIAIGDPRQAIYHWRGADRSSVEDTIKQLGATVVQMSTTYRCARAIVEHAKTAVKGLDDFTARPDAPDGRVERRTVIDLIGPYGAHLGDYVLSRTNAPLVALAAFWLRRGMPIVVTGRDIGVSLIALVERSGATTTADLRRWLVDYLVAEIERLDGNLEALNDIRDRVWALQALAESSSSPAALINTLRQMYRIPAPKRGRAGGQTSSAAQTELTDKDIDPSTVVTLSSIHRAKGRERERVWLLEWTHDIDRGKTEEGDNCYYVGVTRAKETLYLVSRPGREDRAHGVSIGTDGRLDIAADAGVPDVCDFGMDGQRV